jgi:hypothetical protein
MAEIERVMRGVIGGSGRARRKGGGRRVYTDGKKETEGRAGGTRRKGACAPKLQTTCDAM